MSSSGGNAGGQGSAGGRGGAGRNGQGSSGGPAGGRGRGGPPDTSRRNAQGRERNRGPKRNFTEQAPSQRTRRADPARLVAFEVLRAVAQEDAYANLVLPARIRHHHLDKRDAGFATELSYGALRGQGTYDAILARCVDRPLSQLDPAVLDALRIGAHQLLAMRVPAHAALDQTVGLARAVIGAGPSALINAVLRKVSARTLEEWLDLLVEGETDQTKIAALRFAHPEWIVRAMRQSLVAHGRPATEIDGLLEADNAAPVVNLVALPGLGSLDEALENGAAPGELVEGSALSSGGDLGRLASVRAGTTRVQDVGSQLVARALAQAPLEGPDSGRWLDLCAGPGGKAALLGALAEIEGARVDAVEKASHRAELISKSTRDLPVDVHVADGRDPGLEPGFDRVLVDAPCTGLGALRRRPEARWRRSPNDVAELVTLQHQLLTSGVELVRPGGVVVYSTCSPHPAETAGVVDRIVAELPVTPLDTRELVPGGIEGLGNGPSVQLWPHLHGTDAMFFADLRKD